MCGIAGYVQRIKRDSGADDTIERMTARLAHRGPDGSSIWRSTFGDWEIALGHRRLAIIDLEGGKQPLSNEDGSIQITYNGEIYNYRALSAGLRRRGHSFATNSDTEAIVHQYEECGWSALATLSGMFAFGVWDQRKGQLLLARDRIGIKPLYYAPLPCGGIAFASELTALLEHREIDRRLDPKGLSAYFFSDCVPPPLTIVRGARKLPPGHGIIWTPAGLLEARPFWSLNAEIDATHDEHSATEALEQKLEAAVTAQLVADVPVGVFLSGGIDSSLVAAIAQRHTRERLQTFSIGFDDPQFDESRYARIVSRHLRTKHVEQQFSESSLLECLDAAIGCLDEPMADPSILPTYALSRLAAEHVKVVLGGDGGDELWAGYPTYKAHLAARTYAKLPRFLRSTLGPAMVSRLPVRHGYQSLEWKAKRFALRWDDDAKVRHFRWMSNLDLRDLHLATGASQVDLPAPLDQLALLRCDDRLNQILHLDLRTYLPGSVLTKVDRASMAHGLEVRPPLIDNDLVTFAFSLPSSFKLRGRRSKYLLKRVAEKYLPRQIVHRRKKGFAIPLARWLNGPLKCRVDDVVASSPLWEIGLLNRDAFGEWAREHAHYAVDRSKPLWALLVLDHWYRSLTAP